MVDREESDSPIATAVGTAGEQVTEAFELLGNETRLAILLALWEAVEPWGEGDAVLSFSELRDAVGIRDSGQFNYHLDQLVGTYLLDTEGGYRLMAAGFSIIEAVIAGAGIENPQREPTELDVPCPLCGSPTVVGYQNEYIYQACTECKGEYGKYGAMADAASEYGGLLFVAVLDPAGLADRTPEEIYEAGILKSNLRSAMQMAGVCSRCSGPIEAGLFVCEDHETGDGITCEHCYSRWGFRPQFTCTLCKYTSAPIPMFPAMFHPVVIDFFADHGITIGDFTNPETIVRMEPLMRDQEAELVETTPPRVRITIRHDGDEIQLDYDGDMNFVEVSK